MSGGNLTKYKSWIFRVFCLNNFVVFLGVGCCQQLRKESNDICF